jgi:hypothetical protein
MKIIVQMKLFTYQRGSHQKIKKFLQILKVLPKNLEIFKAEQQQQ